VIVGVIAHLYVRYGTLPQAAAILYGVNPVVIVVVVQALIGLSRTAVRNLFLAAMALLGILLVVLGIHELVVLLAVGIVTAAASAPRCGPRVRATPAVGIGLLGAGSASASVVPAVSLASLFLFFLKVGSVLFGSGYVLLAFLRADLVERWHWLSERQLLDAIAVGQMTPGPVFTTATFVGYLLAGKSGAVLATVGIFLPAFVFVAASGPLLRWLRRSATMRSFLDGVNVASLALMAVVAFQLGRAAVVDVVTAVIAIASGALLLHRRVDSTWLIMGGGLVGLAIRMGGCT
jgi:chromate transporter